MKNFPKEKITGIVGSVLVHAILAVLLYFLVLTSPVDLPETGVEVMMGVDVEDVAKAQFNEAPQQVPQPVPVQPAPPAPKEPLITQDSEESLALPPETPKKETPKKQEKTPEQIQKEKEEAERKEQERKEEEARKAAQNSIANAFNKGSQMSKKGDAAQEESTKGSIQGNSDAGLSYGKGISFSGNLEGRGCDGLAIPKEKLQAEGKVVVEVVVAPNGNVINAAVIKGTDTMDPNLRNAAMKAAMNTVFKSIAGVDNETGTITYNFELK